MKTVKQVSDLTGISVRMLHHYDKIGLFKPSQFSEVGYRLYSNNDLKLLQQILFFKELDFPLKEIKSIVTNPSFDKQKALKNHKQLLKLRRNRLDRLINLVNKTLEGECKMSFKEFDVSEINKVQKKYAKEAKELYGDTDAYKDYLNKTSKYDKNCWNQIGEEISGIFTRFSNVMAKGANSEEAQSLVKEWQNYITQNFYHCTDNILKNLGKMYIKDIRFSENLNKYQPGLAEFINEAIEIYCK